MNLGEKVVKLELLKKLRDETFNVFEEIFGMQPIIFEDNCYVNLQFPVGTQVYPWENLVQMENIRSTIITASSGGKVFLNTRIYDSNIVGYAFLDSDYKILSRWDGDMYGQYNFCPKGTSYIVINDQGYYTNNYYFTDEGFIRETDNDIGYLYTKAIPPIQEAATHNNREVLDAITAEKVAAWDAMLNIVNGNEVKY